MTPQPSGLTRTGRALALLGRKYDYKVDYRPEATRKVASGVSLLRRGEQKQDVVDAEVLCIVTEGNPSGGAAQPKHREAVIGFWSNTEAETRKERRATSTVLDVDKALVTTEQFYLKQFL